MRGIDADEMQVPEAAEGMMAFGGVGEYPGQGGIVGKGPRQRLHDHIAVGLPRLSHVDHAAATQPPARRTRAVDAG